LEGLCLPVASTATVIAGAGSFDMGTPQGQPCRFDDELLRTVTLTQTIEAAATEVTVAQWEALMVTNPSSVAACPGCPIDMVNWYDALAWCNARSVAEGLPPCYQLNQCQGVPGSTTYGCASASVTAPGGNVYACEGYRLPTVAEWEYLARGGTTTGTWAGDLDTCTGTSSVLQDVAWYVGNSGGSGPYVVAALQANPWGLYDVLGNLLEWCWDPWGTPTSDAPVTNPVASGNGGGALQTCRGGAWPMEPWANRAAYRSAATRFQVAPFRGFRWVRTLP
jgi:formylglycine-generating enzyme required for sulfatase activity